MLLSVSRYALDKNLEINPPSSCATRFRVRERKFLSIANKKNLDAQEGIAGYVARLDAHLHHYTVTSNIIIPRARECRFPPRTYA